ncbi:MAG: hypothetical protein U0800_19060 [Isosphaeraceae bacterium]
MVRSLRWRLQAWHALILLLVVAGFGAAFYFQARRARFDEIDAELLAGARVLEGVLRSIPPAALAERMADDRPADQPPPPPPQPRDPPFASAPRPARVNRRSRAVRVANPPPRGSARLS